MSAIVAQHFSLLLGRLGSAIGSVSSKTECGSLVADPWCFMKAVHQCNFNFMENQL